VKTLTALTTALLLTAGTAIAACGSMAERQSTPTVAENSSTAPVILPGQEQTNG
jgi:hypothetical protein